MIQSVVYFVEDGDFIKIGMCLFGEKGKGGKPNSRPFGC